METSTCDEYLAERLTIFVIGASGDLAKKKTYPSLFSLYCANYLPKHVIIVGYARSKITDDDFRGHIGKSIEAKSDMESVKKREFLSVCLYRSGNYDSAQDVGKVSNEIENMYVEHTKQMQSLKVNHLFYFAIPPSVFVPIGSSIKQSALSVRGWNRLIVEKPFGHDLISFDKLSSDMSALYREDEFYRIDHYLGKEMVQNLLIMRFANAIFEPIWNHQYISSVLITFKEDIGTQGRGGYFDNYGIIRDVMQNHLLQVLSLIAMEPPVQASNDDHTDYIRDEKVKVLNCIDPIKLDESVLGQYDGDSELQQPGYKEDPTVPDDSITPTFATCVLKINNARWEGVPFIMKAGKALNERKAEVRIQFHRPPGVSKMFPNIQVPSQELVIRLQPDEAVYMKLNVKSPGLGSNTISSELDLSYSKRYAGAQVPEAYTRLILDVLRGKQAAFVRDDELRAAWRIFTPLLHEIETKKIQPIKYPFGSRGPMESDRLLETMGYRYHRGSYQWEPVSNKSNL